MGKRPAGKDLSPLFHLLHRNGFTDISFSANYNIVLLAFTLLFYLFQYKVKDSIYFLR